MSISRRHHPEPSPAGSATRTAGRPGASASTSMLSDAGAPAGASARQPLTTSRGASPKSTPADSSSPGRTGSE